MVDADEFLDGLEGAQVRFVTGVPDSLLKHVCARISTRLSAQQHIIATSEGSAVALAMGHYLATGNPALVYLQNSGLGNTVNPLTSLADPDVYAIPMLLMVGWRGEIQPDGSQLRDEPQHRTQGRITAPQLDLLRIPYAVLHAETAQVSELLTDLVHEAKRRSGPVALLVRKNTFTPVKEAPLDQPPGLPTREEAIRAILRATPPDVPLISTTGMASRELFELRKFEQEGHHRDFLTVGGMGHASQIAAGIAMAQPDRRVVCVDGDGAALMHMGAMAVSADCANLIHILINNEAHDSVGGQPTKGNVLNFAAIARELGYASAYRVSSLQEFHERIVDALDHRGSVFLEIKCRIGSRAELGRPDREPVQNKRDFMAFLGSPT